MLTFRVRSRAIVSGVCLAAALQLFAPRTAGAACTCLNNATVIDLDTNTGGDDGQFAERVVVTAPDGQTWSVTQPTTGAYDAFAVPPVGTRSPLVPIATDGSVKLQALGGGQYVLDFVFVEAVGYTLSVTNQSGTTLRIDNNCRYPNPTFLPPVESSYQRTDPPVVLGATAVTGPPLASATFTIDGMPATRIVPLDLTPMPAVHVAELTATGTAGADNYQACVQGVRKGFVIVVASASAPAINAAWGGVLLVALLGLGVTRLRRAGRSRRRP